MTKNNWFEIDKEGLGQLQGGTEKWRLVNELIQNAFDENIKKCLIDIKDIGNGESAIVVIDDCPEGFKFLKDAYTLFGYTAKRKDPSKRGRFNVGEKQIISVCECAWIKTTKGMIEFAKDGTRREFDNKTQFGSEVTLHIKMKDEDVIKVVQELKRILPPKGVVYKVNGETIYYKEAFKKTDAVLVTEIFDDVHKIMKRTEKTTTVHIHEVKEGEKAWLYEIGMPVREVDDRYSVDVQQKIPLTLDRSQVLPSYLRRLRAVVLNEVHETLTEEDSGTEWVRDATRDKKIKKEALQTVATKRWGEKRCFADYNNPDSIERAIAGGYAIVRPSEMDALERQAFRDVGAVEKSSVFFEKGVVEGVAIPEKDWTEDQKFVVEYAKMIAFETVHVSLRVMIVKSPKSSTIADYADGFLRLNTSLLSSSWWASRVSEQVTDLLIHEIAHEEGLHHLTEDYYKSLTRIGAKLTMLALQKPKMFKIGETR